MIIQKIKLLFIFYGLSWTSLCNAQYQSNRSTQIFEYCYNFKFKSADSLLKIFSTEAEGRDIVEVNLLESNILWWKIVSGLNDESLKKQFYNKLHKSEKLIEARKKSDFPLIFKTISMYGYLSRMDILSENYFKAFFRIRKCIRYLKASFGNETKYPFFFLTTGLYNYYRANAGDSYPLLIPYLKLYPSGNKENGISFLEKASESNNRYLNTEANYFLMKIYLDENKHSLSYRYSEVLCPRFPGNGLFMYYKYLCLLKSGRKNDAWVFMKSMINSLSQNPELSPKQIQHFKGIMMENWEESN
jgi:hypothetical protein